MEPRVVFDCMVYLQGAARTGSPAAACFRLVEGEQCTLSLSPLVLAEVQDVLNRPELRKKFPVLCSIRQRFGMPHPPCTHLW